MTPDNLDWTSRLSWGKPERSSCAGGTPGHTRCMRDVFACTKCNSIYAITRRREKPLVSPRCQVCFASFPPSELGDWLAYARAEPEWTLSEWLGVHTSPFSLPSPRQAFTELAQREIQRADPALPLSRLQKLSSFGSL